jgi:hypothetical protein
MKFGFHNFSKQTTTYTTHTNCKDQATKKALLAERRRSRGCFIPHYVGLRAVVFDAVDCPCEKGQNNWGQLERNNTHVCSLSFPFLANVQLRDFSRRGRARE